MQLLIFQFCHIQCRFVEISSLVVRISPSKGSKCLFNYLLLPLKIHFTWHEKKKRIAKVRGSLTGTLFWTNIGRQRFPSVSFYWGCGTKAKLF